MEELKLVKDNGKKSIVTVGDVKIGDGFLVIAGPCSVENENQINESALAVKKAGANILRGGAYKPRSSPYSFQGLGKDGLILLSNAGKLANMPVITEVIDTRDIELVCRYADIIQIGARNMQNYSLLTEVGKTGKPVMLKRGFYATVNEWLSSAEYILNEGNKNVILCERGIRTFETLTRNTLDLSSVALLRKLTHLPIIVDPSHATGRADLIEPMSLSAILSGCDGLMIEVHPTPNEALSDTEQAISTEAFAMLMGKIENTVEFKKTI